MHGKDGMKSNRKVQRKRNVYWRAYAVKYEWLFH